MDVSLRLKVFVFYALYFEHLFRAHAAGIPQAQNQDCLQELGPDDGSGRYPRLISQAFLEDMVVPTGPKRNLWCSCDRDDYNMDCVIIVQPGSLQETVVRSRFQVAPESLRPFLMFNVIFTEEGTTIPEFMFENSICTPPVYAFMHITSDLILEIKPPMQRRNSAPARLNQQLNAPNVPLRRTQSSPSLIHHPIKTIPLALCGEDSAVCPITQNDFKRNDMVYVLKTEIPKLESGKAVCCVSAEGLRALSRMNEGSFIDPLKRAQEAMLTMANYESRTVVAPETGEAGPSCSNKPRPKRQRQDPEKYSTFGQDPESSSDLKQISAVLYNFHHFHMSFFIFTIFILLFSSFTSRLSHSKANDDVYVEFL